MILTPSKRSTAIAGSDSVGQVPSRPTGAPYLDSGPVASDTFMENVENLPVQERER